MSEFSLSSTTSKKTHFLSLLLSDLFLFCSFILSHPLYFFYFVFLSPYLFRLLSFLSPLFITTFLLLSVLLTFSPDFVHESPNAELSESKVSFILGMYQAVVERLRSKLMEDENEEFSQFEELEVYKIVFDTSNVDIGRNPVEVLEQEGKENCVASDESLVIKSSSHEGTVRVEVCEMASGNLDGNSVAVPRPESSRLIAEEKKSEALLHQKHKLEEFTDKKQEKEVKPLSDSSNKVEEQKEKSYMRSGSKAMDYKLREGKVSCGDGGEYIRRINSERIESHPWSPDYNSPTRGSNLGSFGLMRKEKEWRRTLACKLFEERHNVDHGGEGMDLLWETYETDAIKMQAKSKSKKEKKGKIAYFHDEEEDEEEEEGNDGQLCCLQALKFSAGKMNLGMGKPNLVKISKALKGIGWLRHVTKHGKKGYH